MKNFRAILFALVITGVIAAAMFVIGGNALANKNSVPMADSPQQASISTSTVSGDQQQQIAQLEALVKQYQDREKQYQTQLNTAAQRLNDANAQISQADQQLQQFQQLLVALQQQGVIRITRSGQIMLPSTSGFGGGFGDDGANQSTFQ